LAPLTHFSPGLVGQGLAPNNQHQLNNGQAGLENILSSVDSRLGLSTGGGAPKNVADMPSFEIL
tara:strand:+ start:662 stop:853 length:192 start_codon:yes stop_codon:yes gene_type:complete